VKTIRPRLYIVLLSLLVACEKAIDFKIESPEPKLVVEASIENDTWPIVYLTKSLDYYSALDPYTIQQSFVRNADVFVSNGTRLHKLKEYEIPLQGGYSIYYYSADSANLGTAFKGELNKQYILQIQTGGKEYTASTTIPNITKRIDSIWGRSIPTFYDPNKRALMVKATDPPGYGDYIRYFTKRNGEPFYPGLNSVFDDQVIDGTTYTVEVEKGVDRNADRPEGFVFFNKFDTVTLKLCNIDKATFDFWRTMEFSYSSVGNPFSSPTKVLGNITGGALGYFGGYAAQFKTVIMRD
jgi:Domain of unknown function (DUF4249)